MTDRNNEMDIQTETERQIMKKIKYRNDKITFETFFVRDTCQRLCVPEDAI